MDQLTCPWNYMVIEGVIGVGKTSLTRMLSESFGARMNLEVVEDNPFLPRFYEDKDAHAFVTQMFFLLSRFRQLGGERGRELPTRSPRPFSSPMRVPSCPRKPPARRWGWSIGRSPRMSWVAPLVISTSVFSRSAPG